MLSVIWFVILFYIILFTSANGMLQLIVYKIIPEDEPYFEAPAQPEEPEESEPEKESEPEEESEPDKEPEKKDNAWTTEEITLLTKGLTKYPVGTRNRYQLVAELVGTRTVKEIIEQTKIGASETAQGLFHDLSPFISY